VPTPQCILKNVFKLTPGHYLEVDLSGEARDSKPYWLLRDMVATRRLDLRAADDPSLIEELDQLLTKSVGQRMLSDVPLGAFLSGGVDSSAIVALMQKQSSRPVKTFTIGFGEINYNEAAHAAEIARYLGTEHYEYYITSQDCVDVIARLPEIYDEPFADSSQIPTTLVSQFARRQVTVALSGDAGDELFGGYNRYVWSQRIWPMLSILPTGLRRIGRDMAYRLSPEQWDRVFSAFNPILPGKFQLRSAGEKLHKLANAVGASDTDALYRSYVSQWHNPEQVVIGNVETSPLMDDARICPAGLHYVEKMMYLDQITYLPFDILCKVDRATMSTSLEARVPFLDNDVARFAWSLPISTKLHSGISKWPLRQLLKRYIPDKLFERPKTGFGIPVGEWLRGPLRDWAESMLSEQRLRSDGYFQSDVVRKQWQEHLSGRRNLQHSLWSVLMFQALVSHWKNKS
jgi:asparagine synthase (glutamine-hydrolysing)